MMNKMRIWYELVMTRGFDRLRSPLLLVLRAYIGYQFFIAGLGKLKNLQQFQDVLTNLGVPAPALNAPFVASLECFGGLLLLVGLASRLIAIPLAINMIVAYVTADHEALVNVFNNPDGFIAATPFLFLLVSLIVLAFGPGIVSVDALLERFVFRRDAVTAAMAFPKPA